MQIILLKDIKGVGKKFDIKKISGGYANNFLIPQGLALVATKDEIKKRETEKARMIAEVKIKEDLLSKNMGDLKDLVITIKADKVNDKGHLFAQIHNEQIAKEIKKQTHLDILPEFVHAESPIKEVGEHILEVKAGNKSIKIKVVVEK